MNDGLQFELKWSFVFTRKLHSYVVIYPRGVNPALSSRKTGPIILPSRGAIWCHDLAIATIIVFHFLCHHATLPLSHCAALVRHIAAVSALTRNRDWGSTDKANFHLILSRLLLCWLESMANQMRHLSHSFNLSCSMTSCFSVVYYFAPELRRVITKTSYGS